MLDQATRLRAMMYRASAKDERASPCTILLCGSQRSVGTTTIAANLAYSLGRRRSARLASALDPDQPRAGRAQWTLQDAGSLSRSELQSCWQRANTVLLVTTADSVAIMDAYTAIKLHASRSATRPIQLVVNQTGSTGKAEDACHRLDRSCRRFLGVEVMLAGGVPLDPCVIAAAEHAALVTQRYQDCSAAVAIESIARSLEVSLSISHAHGRV